MMETPSDYIKHHGNRHSNMHDFADRIPFPNPISDIYPNLFINFPLVVYKVVSYQPILLSLKVFSSRHFDYNIQNNILQ